MGQKTGRGFYRYEPGDRTPRPDPEVAEIAHRESAALGIERREVETREIIERCLFALVNEGARILTEGIAEREGDVDVVWTLGYGFPKERGRADALGAAPGRAGPRWSSGRSGPARRRHRAIRSSRHRAGCW